MKIPWPLYLAWKQLFPSQRKFSFFSLLAVVGVALGVNVMIVVVAFMKGFQHKFREDIIDAQGHARAFPLRQPKQWQAIRQELINNPQIDSASSYIQGPVLLQNRNDQSIPFAMGLDPAELPQVLPLDEFLQRGHSAMDAKDTLDVTPVPTTEKLADDVIFVSRYVANRLGTAGCYFRMSEGEQEKQQMDEGQGVVVERLDSLVPSGSGPSNI